MARKLEDYLEAVGECVIWNGPWELSNPRWGNRNVRQVLWRGPELQPGEFLAPACGCVDCVRPEHQTPKKAESKQPFWHGKKCRACGNLLRKMAPKHASNNDLRMSRLGCPACEGGEEDRKPFDEAKWDMYRAEFEGLTLDKDYLGDD